MIPILFEYDETLFTSHGIGDLVDCTSCECECNDDGEYEMSFVYPKDGELFSELTIGRQVLAKANPWQQAQIFRIYGYGKELSGKIVVNCEHISYDLNRIPVRAFKSATSATCNTALQNMVSNAMSITGLSINKFSFYSDVEGTAQTQDGYYELEAPSSARAALLDGDDSIKGVFGGNLVFDRYNVKLLKAGSEEGGLNRGVLVEYGVDLMDLQQEENISEMYTGVFPYFRYTPQDAEDEVVVYGDIQYASGTFQNHKVMPLDMTEYFPNQSDDNPAPSKQQINSKAQEWISMQDGFGEPEINLTISYASLGQDVRLHDQITVRFVKMGIDKASKVTAYKFDVLKERMIEVQVGKTKQSILFSLEDASRLKKGLLPPKRIQSKSITSDKYADGSVGSSAIGGGAVTGGKIAGGAVTSNKIATGAVAADKLADNSVTVNKIVNGAITSEKIKDGAISTDKVVNGAITLAKLWDDFEVFYSDIVAAFAFYGNYVQINGALHCGTLYPSGLVFNGSNYGPGTITMVDTHYTASNGSLEVTNSRYTKYCDLDTGAYYYYLSSLSGSVGNNYDSDRQTFSVVKKL